MTSDEAGARRYRWVIEAAVLLLQFSMGLSFLAPAPLFPLIIDDFEVSRATASLLVGVTALGVGLAMIPCSILAARLGTRASLALERPPGGGTRAVVTLPFVDDARANGEPRP